MAINVCLDKKDLVSLVKGTQPSFAFLADKSATLEKLGLYSGSYGRWEWGYSGLEFLSEKELYDLYLLIKNNP